MFKHVCLGGGGARVDFPDSGLSVREEQHSHRWSPTFL